MVAERKKLNQKGQSIVEFLLMLPMLFGMTIVLIKVNTLIQMSIVDQQYARAQALFLAFNSPIYPERGNQIALGSAGFNQMVLGVAETPYSKQGQQSAPTALSYNITRTGAAGPNDQDPGDPTGGVRAAVRVRDTVTLCTPSLMFKPNGTNTLILPSGAPSALGELQNSSAFAYCGSPLKYE